MTISVAASRPANTIIPRQALGAGVDGLDEGDIARVYTPANLKAMSSAGFQPLTYRLRTELGVEAWHWNPRGRWSDVRHRQGYWTSADTSPTPILKCYGYRLPRRGDTVDQANNDGYSRLDDGDPHTFWKSNPYLDRHFTGEDNVRHPQWVVVDLGKPEPVSAIRIRWAVPYATQYAVDYWDGPGTDVSHNIQDTQSLTGVWRPFPDGAVAHGTGGAVTRRLCATPRLVRYVRLRMTASAHHAPRGGRDVRDALGYAIRELGVGTVDHRGRFQDRVRHQPDRHQTVMVVSSTDPWHRAQDRDPNVEQPGFDRVFASGLTHGLPMLTPVGVLYDTPPNAAAEVRYLKKRGYPVRQVELGEEPDGQFATPQDYAALYAQYADALHTVSPSLQLGGPSLQTVLHGTRAWPDATGSRSWVRQFMAALAARGRRADLTFFSFEWYPFDSVCAPSLPQLLDAPNRLSDSLARLYGAGGLPRTLPLYVSEYGFSAFAAEAEVDVTGALFNADAVGQFLTAGGARAYFYGYEPNSLLRESPYCPAWGNLALYLADDDRHIKAPLAAYHAARLLTRAWASPADKPLRLYRASSDRRPWVTAYALQAPDGRWSLLLINKDPAHAYRLHAQFQGAALVTTRTLRGPVSLWQYGRAQYRWHSQGEHGSASPNGPPVYRRDVPADAVTLPPFSLSVIRTRDASAW